MIPRYLFQLYDNTFKQSKPSIFDVILVLQFYLQMRDGGNTASDLFRGATYKIIIRLCKLRQNIHESPEWDLFKAT